MKEPLRPLKKQNKNKNKTKGKKRKEKERGGNITILLNPHLCFKVALVLQFVEIFLCTTCIRDPNAIELGLHIPMMSLLKSALGLREQTSWMHPHWFLWRPFLH